MVPKMQTSVGTGIHWELRVLKATTRARACFCALLPPYFKLFPSLSLALSRRVVSLPLHACPRSLPLSSSVLHSQSPVGWLTGCSSEEGGRETTASAPLARGRGRRARGLRQLTHIFPIHLQARLASSRSSLSPSARLFPFASLRSCRWRTARPRPSLRRPRRWKEN